MPTQTKQALEASIKHWRENLAAESPEKVRLGPGNCALCALFHPKFGGSDECDGCPVAERTGERGCSNTPYGDAIDTHYDWSFFDESDPFRAAARKMIEFLESIREEE